MVRKILLDLKSIWKTLLLMGALAYGILPMLNHYRTIDLPIELSFGITMQQTQLFLPAASAVPVAMLLRYQLEEGCAEPIHTIPAVTRQGPLALLVTEIVLLTVYILPLFLLYTLQFNFFPWQELLRTIVQGFFLQNLAFATGYFSHFSLACLGAQVLVIGAMQLPLLDHNTVQSLSRTINIYSYISELAPRPWEPLRIIITALCAGTLWRIGTKREKFFLDSIDGSG